MKIVLFVGLLAGASLLPTLESLDPETVYHLRPVLRFVSILLALNIALVLFNSVYRRKKGLTRRQDDAILLGLQNVYYILVVLLSIAAGITLYGLELKDVFYTLSIIAAAIAIVTKDFLAEIISGLIMSFSGQLSVGDYISLGTTKGRVTTLTLTKVVLLNEDDDLVHVPNSRAFGGELVNYTQRMQRRVSIEFAVALANLPSVDAFEAALTDALRDYTDSIVPNSHSLRVVELHKDSAEFKFRYTLHQRSPSLERDIRRRTSRTVINYIQSVSRGPETTEPSTAITAPDPEAEKPLDLTAPASDREPQQAPDQALERRPAGVHGPRGVAVAQP